MVNILGLDIGGANTKAAFVRTNNGRVEEFKAALEYFPFWKRDVDQFCTMLSAVKGKVAGSATLDCVGVTLTAELSDVYRTKREGVNNILDCVSQVFGGTIVMVLDVDASLRSVESAKAEPLAVAAANWAATGWMISRKIRDCVVVDVGSTTTSIIPVTGGKVAAEGKTDLDKLINGELVYTGSLRTNVATIVNSVIVRGGVARISSELFAQRGDVHLVLGNIKAEDYNADTADSKGKTRSEALARLARIVCADTEMLSEQEILQISAYIYKQQVDQIAEGLSKVYQRLGEGAEEAVPVVITGFGKDFLARKAAYKVGIVKILNLEELLPKGISLASPATGVALMAATKLEGRCVKWTQ